MHKGKSLMKLLDMTAGSVYEQPLTNDMLLFVHGGAIELTNMDEVHTLITGEIIVLPTGSQLSLRAKEETAVVMCKLIQIWKICPNYNIERLMRLQAAKARILSANGPLLLCLRGIHACLNAKFLCSHFETNKLNEMFILLRAYYAPEELAGFFRPLYGKHTDFRTQFYESYKDMWVVDRLAEHMNMTKDGFIRKFRLIFGTTPGAWLLEKKIELIRRDLADTRKSIKEISYSYGFSHVSTFSAFCTKYLGSSPRQFRKDN